MQPAEASTESPKHRFLRVAIDTPLRRLFDYLPAPGLSALDYPVGTRCEVPFGRRTLIGLVIGHAATSELKIDALKMAAMPTDSAPLVNNQSIELIKWVCTYYRHPIGNAAFTLLPSYFSRPGSAQPYRRTAWRVSRKGHGLNETALSRAPKQQALLQILREHGDWLDIEAIHQQGFKNTVLKELSRKELIESAEIPQTPTHCRSLQAGTATEQPLPLNAEQQAALDSCLSAQQAQRFNACLIDGITGSGKTEVYLQATESALAAGKQVLVLVPEIALTPQTLNRFTTRFSCQIAIMHSGLNDKERAAAWLAMRDGTAQVLLGTRSAIATPLAKPGLIIVDEEHDSSYKQQDSLRYCARDLAVWRARQLNLPVLLGSATPSLESYSNAFAGKYEFRKLNQRHAGATSATTEFLDIRKQPLVGGLSDHAIDAIRATLDRKKQVMVFLNRRGYAPQLLCHDCGWSATCDNCDAMLTLHKQRRHLRCHHCGHERKPPSSCMRCQSKNVQPIGDGTERCEETLRSLFSDTTIIRVDRDTVRTASELENTLQAINTSESSILIGTQMLAKGHHFPRLETVIMLNIDNGLYSHDFRAVERTVQLLTQVAGRAGRESQTGRVLIQTHIPDHPVLMHWQAQDYEQVAKHLLEQRQQRGLPPKTHMAIIGADSPDANAATVFLQETAMLLQQRINHKQNTEQFGTNVSVVGPLPAMMERRAGRHRFYVQVISATRAGLQNLLGSTIDSIDSMPKKRSLRWQIDIDPQLSP